MPAIRGPGGFGACCSQASLRTTNVIVLALVIAVATQVVVARADPDSPWSRIQRYVLSFAVIMGVLRLGLVAAFAPRTPGTVLLTLPTLDLPTWMAGVSVGGPVTTGAMFTGVVESLRLIALLAAFTVPASLVSPHRTVRALPDGVAELGVITTVALTVTPAAAEHVRRLAETRRLRGRPHRGIRGMRGSITAVSRARSTIPSPWPPRWRPVATAGVVPGRIRALDVPQHGCSQPPWSWHHLAPS